MKIRQKKYLTDFEGFGVLKKFAGFFLARLKIFNVDIRTEPK